MNTLKKMNVGDVLTVVWVVLGPLIAIQIFSEDIWEDYFRIGVLSIAIFDAWLTLYIAYYYQFKLWNKMPADRTRFHRRPWLVWCMGVGFLAALQVAMYAMYTELGEPIDLLIFPGALIASVCTLV